MSHFELVVVLLMAAVPLVVAARALRIAYPILLVLGGIALGFLPFVPRISIPPEIVLVIFLPPLLYNEAYTGPPRAFRVFATPILRLAVGLVLATTAAVAGLIHLFVPDLPWGAAAAFGAIVAPTDEVAFMPIAERLAIPRRVVAIVQGESLLNDATSLVLYAVAIDAVTRGSFSWLAAGWQLVWGSVAAVALGLVAGVVTVGVLRVVRDPMLDVLVSLLAGYLAYIPAQHLGFSGVLATVTSALYAARFMPPSLEPSARVLSRGMWPVLIFVLNTTIFIFVGLQSRDVIANLHGTAWTTLGLWAASLSALVIGIRIVWVLGVSYPLDRIARGDRDVPEWRNYALTSWAGFRGGVSLAAALAIPLLGPHGTPFPHRSLLIFLTLAVIIATLVGQGATLPYVQKRLGVVSDDERSDESERDAAIMEATRFSLRRLDRRVRDGRTEEREARALRERYERHVLDDDESGEVRDFHRAELRLLADQHLALVGMRDRGTIENTTFRHLETHLDFKRLQIEEEVTRGDALDDEGMPDDARARAVSARPRPGRPASSACA
ncbi:MAG: Na+/H+ antiporter [Candidatus Eremiobacteraeota bacterium]|nr:Na+/H+ antiporter [Candidatus Eremiobacteraeota bacterium]